MSTGAPGVLVVGAGLVGTSVALGARAAGWQVWLQDSDADAVALAEELGAGTAEPPTREPDLVIVAVPPRAAADVIVRQLGLYLEATISDVCSVKSDLMIEVEAQGGDVSRYVPGHPLAGSEVSGARGARSTLFSDRVWVLTPSGRTDTGRTAAVAGFAEQLGAVTLQSEAAVHDRAVALTSHLPQLVSSVLAGRLVGAGVQDTRLAGQGLRDMTRIAASDPALWTQILASNAGAVLAELEPMLEDLGRARDALESISRSGPGPAPTGVVTGLLERGNAGRARIPGKHGGTGTATGSLVVTVPDEPGQLAALFALAGRARVNLEDVRIDHALGRPTGLVELEVGSAQVEPLRAALVEAGWAVVQAGR